MHSGEHPTFRAARESCPVLMTSGGGYKLPVTVAANLSQIEALAG